MAETENNTAAVVRDIMTSQAGFETIVIEDQRDDAVRAEIAIVPVGKKIENLEPIFAQYRQKPLRRKGTHIVTDLASLIEVTNRFKDGDSVLFANEDRIAPSMTAVLNWHRQGAAGDPAFGDHRVHYAFPVSDEWKAWTEACIDEDGEKKWLSQREFAEFIEDHIINVIPPPAENEQGPQTKVLLERTGLKLAGPEKLMDLSKGLAVNEGKRVEAQHNLQSGAATLRFQTEHTDAAGAPLVVPGAFVIQIPVFLKGAVYPMPVRLRYRVANGGVVWSFELYLADHVFDDAFKGACDQAKENTKLPLFFGKPE